MPKKQIELTEKEKRAIRGKVIRFVLANLGWTLLLFAKVAWYFIVGGDFLDQDYYKLLMGQFMFKFYQNVQGSYRLKVRSKQGTPDGFEEKLMKRLERFARDHHSISHRQRLELAKLKNPDGAPVYKADFLDFLEDRTRPKLDASKIKVTGKGPKAVWTIERGPVYINLYWEIHFMSQYSALLNEMLGQKPQGDWWYRAAYKVMFMVEHGIRMIEFGTRRRLDFLVQFWVIFVQIAVGGVAKDAQSGGLIGTSNVFMALLFKRIPMMGTIAHENHMQLNALFGHDVGEIILRRQWRSLYGSTTLLSDTLTTPLYLSKMTAEEARFFKGFRQDSGDPLLFVDRVLAFYQKHGLTKDEIAQKVIIFSDSITELEQAKIIVNYAKGKGLQALVGIGTFLTNDVGHMALNIVVKPYEVWFVNAKGDLLGPIGCVKVSDALDYGKITGQEDACEKVKVWLESDLKVRTWEPLVEPPQEWLNAA